MDCSWLELLIPLCDDVCSGSGSRVDPQVLTFYLGRWCQKFFRTQEPDAGSLDESKLSDVACRMEGNLSQYASRVERLVAGDSAAWTALRVELLLSARSRAPDQALEHTDEAMQKISLVLLGGTVPSQAVRRLECGIGGPGGEYIFVSPLPLWTRSVINNLIIDERRRDTRFRRTPAIQARAPQGQEDLVRLRQACDALPSLVNAVRSLPPRQRSVMKMTLSRSSLDSLVLERLQALAPDLFDHGPAIGPSDDADIAAGLGTTPRLVAANRSAARIKLADKNEDWALLLDALMPHRSSRQT